MDEQDTIRLNYHINSKGLSLFLGELEAEVMEILWSNGPMTVKRALYHVSKSRKAAYTTVMTVLNRMAEKNIVKRTKEGHSYLYEPVLAKNMFLNYAVKQVMAPLMSDYPEVVNRTIPKLRKKMKPKGKIPKKQA